MSDDRRKRRKLIITDSIPESEWCEIRVLYYSKDRTIEEIAKKFQCDKRTIIRMIRENWNPEEIGKRHAPGKLDAHIKEIESLLKSMRFDDVLRITAVSAALREELQEKGYEGGPKTIERYLRTIPWQELAEQGK